MELIWLSERPHDPPRRYFLVERHISLADQIENRKGFGSSLTALTRTTCVWAVARLSCFQDLGIRTMPGSSESSNLQLAPSAVLLVQPTNSRSAPLISLGTSVPQLNLARSFQVIPAFLARLSSVSPFFTLCCSTSAIRNVAGFCCWPLPSCPLL